jgi:hypothetical protein
MCPKAYPTPPLSFGYNWDSFSMAFVAKVSYLKAIQSYAPPKSLSSNPYNSWQKDDGTYKVKIEIHVFLNSSSHSPTKWEILLS